MKIKLEKYLLSDSTYLTGRREGKDVRKKLKLDKEDKKKDEVIFQISKKITGINVSFFLGLLEKSVKELSEARFKEKYKFEYEDEETEELVAGDVAYGINEALGENFDSWKLL